MPVEKVVENSASRPFFQSRKSSKPLMEKRRRARINSSLNELKNLILDTYRKDGNAPHHSKLEKADILEIAVQHVRSLQRQQMAAAVSTDPAALGRYRAGYSRCRAEVSRFLGTVDGVDPQARQKLLNHLDNSRQTLEARVHCRVAHAGQHVQPVRLQIIDGNGHSNGGLTSAIAMTSPVPMTSSVSAAMYGIASAPLSIAVGGQATANLPDQTLTSSQHVIPGYAYNKTKNTTGQSPVYGLAHSPVPTENGLTTAATYQPCSAQTAVSPAGLQAALPISESDKVWRPW